MRENVFLTLGSPLIDIIVTVEESFLKEHDLKANDAIKSDENHKKLFHDLEKLKPIHQAGGCALNTARALQWVLKTPKLCTVFGSVGRDSYSKILKCQLDHENVNYMFEEVPECETGKCAVLLNFNNRSLCTDLGASKYFSLGYMKNKKVWNIVENAKYYYIPGFFLGVSFECLMEIAEHSSQQGKVFAFNLSAPFLSEMYQKELKELLPLVDIIFGNEFEARAYAKMLGFASSDFYQILLFLGQFPKKNEKRKRITIITRGPKSICLVHENEVTEYAVEKIRDDEIRDTNAAGDAFVGGFMACYIMDKPIRECIMKGIYVANKIIRNIGCSFE